MDKVILIDFSDTLVSLETGELLIDISVLKKISETTKLVLVTNGNLDEVTKYLEKFDIQSNFLAIFTADTSPFKKPDKKLFSLIKSKIPANEYIFIGDSKTDQLFAQNSRIAFFNVTDLSFKWEAFLDKIERIDNDK